MPSAFVKCSTLFYVSTHSMIVCLNDCLRQCSTLCSSLSFRICMRSRSYRIHEYQLQLLERRIGENRKLSHCRVNFILFKFRCPRLWPNDRVLAWDVVGRRFIPARVVRTRKDLRNRRRWETRASFSKNG